MALKAPGIKPTNYDQHLTAKPVQATVSVETKEAKSPWKGPLNETTTVIPGLFDSNGMLLHVEGSRTVNLGDFNSARITVGLTVPCGPENLPEAYDWALGWCSKRINDEVNGSKGQ
jgi:hypothetical protein